MKKVTMKAQHLPSVFINEEKFITREQLSSLLKNYNSYYLDQENLQLAYNQEGSTPFIEGILSIFWGVRHPIRLKIQDEKLIPSFVTLKSTESVGLFPSKRGMTRWGEFDDLYHISGETLKAPEEQPDLEKTYPCYESLTLRPVSEQEHDCATLPRTSSDLAAVRKRTKLPTTARREADTHRFSINGHFYNHETSVFTPAFGSETKIRINSHMRTRQVIEQLLRKFKAMEVTLGVRCAAKGELRNRCASSSPSTGKGWSMAVAVLPSSGQPQELQLAYRGIPSRARETGPVRPRHKERKPELKIENSPHEFALYVIHASGEKKQLRSGDVPLLHRLLQGPSEKIAKFFLMDGDVEEISSDVAQYIPFHLPFLESILHRLYEEEEQEIQQTVARYLKEKSLIRQHLRSRTVRKTETTV